MTFRITSDEAILDLSIMLMTIVMNNVVPWSPTLFKQLYHDILNVVRRCDRKPAIMAIMNIIFQSAYAKDSLYTMVIEPDQGMRQFTLIL